MKLIIERAPLLRTLNHLQSVVERRNTVPILGNVLLKAEGQLLSMTATDMDIELVESVPARVEVEGTTTVSARTFYDIARKLKDGAQIELEIEKNSLCVRSGRSSFTVLTLKPTEFPVMSAGDLPATFKMPAADLRSIIDRTRFAMSSEETRYYLNGIYLHAITEGGLHLRSVATDGHRLARADVALPDGAAEMPGVIVPRKTVIEVRKLIDDAEGEVDVAVGKNKIKFSTGGATMTSKLIDGPFPEYNRVIPHGNDKTIELVRGDFTAAVDRVSTITTDRTRAIKMTFGQGNLTLFCSGAEHGDATEDVDAAYQGDQIVVGFNSRYLLDIAMQIGGDSLRFDLADAGAPAVIRDAGDSSSLYVLMPMRVS